MSDRLTVLDASGLLAVIHRERGWQRVQEFLTSSDVRMSAVNWGEAYAKLTDTTLADAQIIQVLGGLPIRIESFGAEDARRSAVFRRATRAFGLSFGDRACLALAHRLSAAVLTADKAWSNLDLGIVVEQIR